MSKIKSSMSLGLLICSQLLIPSAHSDEVRFEGSLRDMHRGNFQGKVDLADLNSKANLTAVGPLEQLKGEFTAYKGKIFSTQAIDGKLITENLTPMQASFLVWTHATKWTEFQTIDFKSDDLITMESRIEELATKIGINTEKPFSFSIKGVVGEVQYHVLAPPPVNSPKKSHKDGALIFKRENTDVILVGFFSKSHGGVFTHKGSRIHLHVIDGEHTGHIDLLKLNNQMRIEFSGS